MSRFRLFRHVGTPTPTPTPSAVTYDTSIGNAVDSTGRTDLTPRVGAHIYYVNNSTGNDTSATPTNPATPLKTIKKAITSFVTDGNGDHILVAQGMAYANGLANFGLTGGFSAASPFVVQSYDPADPTNQAKWGTATGTNRPDIDVTGTDSVGGFIQGGPSDTARQYRAFRGLKFNAHNTSQLELNVLRGPSGGTPDYLLFENCDFAQAQLSTTFANAAAKAHNIVLRNCAFHGQYDSGNRGDAQGFYSAFTDGVTVEDCVFWNCGWKEGATYTASYTLGGHSIYGHPIYLQDDTRNTTIRRCVFIQNANDGGRPKGDVAYYQNLVFNSDIGVNAGGGDDYDTQAPSGVDLQISYNAFLGGATSGSGGWGIHVVNGKTGSSAHHNVLAAATFTSNGLMADAEVDVTNSVALPCYIYFHDNVLDAWGDGSGISKVLGSSGTVDMTKIHATFDNNYWDDVASGTDHNISSLTRPTRYTVSTLITALGYANLSAAQTAWLSDPASHGWRTGPKLALLGYGIDISGMPFLA